MKIYCNTSIDLLPSNDGTNVAGWDLPSGHTFLFDLGDRKWSDPKSVLGSLEFYYAGNTRDQNNKLLFVNPDRVEPNRKSMLFIIQNLADDCEIINIKQRALFELFQYDETTGTLIVMARAFPELFPKGSIVAKIWFRRLKHNGYVLVTLHTNGSMTIKNLTHYDNKQNSAFVMLSDGYDRRSPIWLHPRTPLKIGDNNVILLRDDLPMETIHTFLNTDPVGNVMILRSDAAHALETLIRYYRTQTIGIATELKVVIIGYDYDTTEAVRKSITRHQTALRRL